ncbi:hypothetical protein K402DRAFT_399050 [Aulographum hederae CBS 113979]|uniref:Uncharacterized protein n=1 Tax=Aulographum hederae CBS 113979 TaxID=1176131 RepID=A0A6G1GIT4_9PEZI|nr:hypothetical protein K402DRAFT_399050 [Aulographum hederae CBS 113979]
MNSPLCSCGSIQSPEHLILSCKWPLLSTKTGIEATIAYIDQTKISTKAWHMSSLAEETEESEEVEETEETEEAEEAEEAEDGVEAGEIEEAEEVEE